MFVTKKEFDKLRENNDLLENTVEALQEICFRQLSIIETLLSERGEDGASKT